MAKKPIFSATHPRACSSAFERVFLTRKDVNTFHEPFGDTFYHGIERLGERYEGDELARTNSGFSEFTFKSVFDEIEKGGSEGKRVFIKDMAYYLMPPDDMPPSIAPSFVEYKRGVGTAMDGEANGTVVGNGHLNGTSNGTDGTSNGTSNGAVSPNSSTSGKPYPYDTAAEPGNPTVVPEEVLRRFHYTFLIRHPRSAIPSYWRCTVPPLDDITGFHNFMPNEAGYAELVRFFDYLRAIKLIGPGTDNEICVIDADDMLDDPEPMIRAYCKSVGMEFDAGMLEWGSEEEQERAREQFEKWPGFHDDALESTGLMKREHKHKPKSDGELFDEWTEKFGEEAACVIRRTVAENVKHYEYLKKFALKV